MVLYELLTGEIPQGAVKPPNALRRNIPSSVSQAVMRSLEGRANDRFASIAEFGQALRSATNARPWRKAILATGFALASVVILAIPYVRPGGWTGSAAQIVPITGSPRADTGAPPVAQAPTQSGAEYGRKLVQVEDLKGQVERIDSELANEVTAARDRVDRSSRELKEAAEPPPVSSQPSAGPGFLLG